MKIVKSTETNYEEIALRLFKKCKKYTLTKNPKWDTVARWMVKEIWPDVKHNTWRLYRSSVNHYVLMNHNELAKEVYDVLNTGKHPSYRNKPLRTSGKKQKYIYGNEFEALIKHLKDGTKKWNVGALAWIQASVHTGLRPCEWVTAEFVEANGDEPAKIIVQNAKNTNGRSHGDTRTVYLNHLTPKEERVVKENMGAIKRMVKSYGYDKYYRRCSEAIRSAGKKLWPTRIKRPTLYSARHQFAANCKKRGLKKVEVAALMGHATDDTATTHYGKKASGTDGKAPQANEEEVNRVKEVAHNPMNIQHDENSADKENG